jgi:hypothetical protein
MYGQTTVDSLNITPSLFQKRTCAFYSFSQNDTVSLTVYNTLAQIMLNPKSNNVMASGYYQDSLIMDAFPNGMYFVVLKLGHRKTINKKIIKTNCTTSLGVFATNTPISCMGACDASATVYVVSGGTPPYNYTWTPTFATTNTISNACSGNYTINAIDFNGCMGSTQLIIFNPSNPCVGIKEYFFNNQISIYPNPVLTTLFISAPQIETENSEIEIINSLGQSVLKLQYQKEIDVSQLSGGCYVFKIVNPNKQQLISKFTKD